MFTKMWKYEANGELISPIIVIFDNVNVEKFHEQVE